MRLFIAVDISERSRTLLHKKVCRFQNNIEQKLKWTAPEKWHLTLKFLGETKKDKVSLISELIASSLLDLQQFTIQFDHIGAFPGLNYPRIIYVGLDNGEAELQKIHSNLEEQLSTSGFEKDNRKYKPHLTLARTSNNTDKEKLADNIKHLKKSKNINIHSSIKAVHLYESKLMAEGPLYKKVRSFSL